MMNKRIAALTAVTVLGAVCLMPMLSEDGSAESYDLRIITSYIMYADFTIVETDEASLEDDYIYMISGGQKDRTMNAFLEDPLHAAAPDGDDRSSLNAHIGETVRVYHFGDSDTDRVQYGGKWNDSRACLQPYNLSYYFDFIPGKEVEITLNEVTDSRGTVVDGKRLIIGWGDDSSSISSIANYGTTAYHDIEKGETAYLEVRSHPSIFYNVDIDIKGVKESTHSSSSPKIYTVRIFPSCLFFADFTIADTGADQLDEDCLYMIDGGEKDAAMKAFLENPRGSAPPSSDDRDSLNENVGKTVRVYKPEFGMLWSSDDENIKVTLSTDVLECTIAYGGEKKDGTVCLKPYNLQDAIEASERDTVNLKFYGVRDNQGNDVEDKDIRFFRNDTRFTTDEVIAYSFTTISFRLYDYPEYYLGFNRADPLFYDVDLEIWVTDVDGKEAYDWSLDVPGFEPPKPGFFEDPEKIMAMTYIAVGALFILINVLLIRRIRKRVRKGSV